MGFHSSVLLLLFLFIFFSTSTLGCAAGDNAARKELKEPSINGDHPHPLKVRELEGTYKFFTLMMDEEDCKEGEESDGGDDEECSRRKMTQEAHLDYIYTQHHKH